MTSYNERLFSGGIRTRLHFARFLWVAKHIRQWSSSGKVSILELGCYDGRLLDFLPPQNIIVTKYLGLDANWGQGLKEALYTRRLPNVNFEFCRSVCDMPKSGEWDISVCMETLEHLPPCEVDEYLKRLSILTSGLSLFTTPVEFGPVFVGKRLGKWLFAKKFKGEFLKYSPLEFLKATFGCLDGIERKGHKGFDARKMVAQISKHFHILSVERIVPVLPLPYMSFQIGICAVPRKHKN